MSFKSYGNVPNGEAIVQKLPISALSAAPTSSSFTWSKTFSPLITAKAARVAGSNVAVLMWGEEVYQATLVMLKASDGSTVWGPTKFGSQHGEGTDIAVS